MKLTTEEERCYLSNSYSYLLFILSFTGIGLGIKERWLSVLVISIVGLWVSFIATGTTSQQLGWEQRRIWEGKHR